MAKTMAEVKNGIITNLLWCNDSQEETETLKDPQGRNVNINDRYENGKWYKDDVELLTDFEALQVLSLEKQDLQIAYREGVNSI